MVGAVVIWVCACSDGVTVTQTLVMEERKEGFDKELRVPSNISSLVFIECSVSQGDIVL